MSRSGIWDKSSSLQRVEIIPKVNSYPCYHKIIHIYYYMPGRAIRGDILFEIDRVGLTEGRDDTEVENGIFPRIARHEELQ